MTPVEIHIDRDRLPTIIHLAVPASLDAPGVQSYLDAFGEQIRLGETFGCVITYVAGRPSKSKEAHALERQWLKQNRPGLARTCAGIVMVHTPSLFASLERIAVRGIGARFFGCPCTTLASSQEAVKWLRP